MNKSMVDTPPGKVLRLGLRLPIWLYRARLGRLLGERFLLLTHIGRKSGLPRQIAEKMPMVAFHPLARE